MQIKLMQEFWKNILIVKNHMTSTTFCFLMHKEFCDIVISNQNLIFFLVFLLLVFVTNSTVLF